VTDRRIGVGTDVTLRRVREYRVHQERQAFPSRGVGPRHALDERIVEKRARLQNSSVVQRARVEQRAPNVEHAQSSQVSGERRPVQEVATGVASGAAVVTSLQ
jgi:hypothetical protein